MAVRNLIPWNSNRDCSRTPVCTFIEGFSPSAPYFSELEAQTAHSSSSLQLHRATADLNARAQSAESCGPLVNVDAYAGAVRRSRFDMMLSRSSKMFSLATLTKPLKKA